MNDQPVSAPELAQFVATLSALHYGGLRNEYPDTPCNWATIEARPGRRYAKLVALRNGGSDGCFGFIDLTNGNILKADGWSTPAKGPRGNIRVGDASDLWRGAFHRNGGGLSVAYLR